ncbi:condensation domain-containing protein, partial [Nostoc sp. CHAB 5715]|uniref:condensation domain-containing protein n=1 Tax=Nostoc sp. CHAB 5715 TaxID=2780400 RepID=UPI001E2ECA07
MKQNNIEDIYELSPMQQGMLFHKLAAPSSVVYFEQACLTLQTQLDVLAFQKAWQRVVDRHPSLRTSFYWEDLDKPYQIVYRQVDLPWEFQDWRKLSLQEQQKQLKVFLKADGDRGFELSQAPLIRITLIQVADDTYEFVFSFHHILMETWSINWLWKEFYEFYQAFCQGKDLYLERPRPYREYIAWLQQQDLHKAEAYWRQKLKGFTVPTPIEVGNISTSNFYQEEEYDRQQIQVSASLTTALKSFARKHQLTLNIVLKGAWALLLSHYSKESDVVFGATSSGRPAQLQEAESMVGLFINTLPLRVQVDSDAFLAPWLKKLQAEEVEMRKYEYSPLVKIQQWSEISRGLQLFDSILDFENELVDYNQGVLAQSIGIAKSQLFDESQSLFDWTNYPLSVNVAPKSDLLNLSISYDTRCFDNATIGRMLGHLETLLEGFVTNPKTKLRELPMLTSKESYQILRKWNDTKVEYPQQQCIHELFEAQVEKTPDAIAVVFENQQLSYRELSQRANQLAHYLQKL